MGNLAMYLSWRSIGFFDSFDPSKSNNQKNVKGTLHSKKSSWQGDPFITDKTERNVCNSQQTIYHQILILKDVNFHMFLAENLENKLHSRKPLDWKISHVSCRKL